MNYIPLTQSAAKAENDLSPFDPDQILLPGNILHAVGQYCLITSYGTEPGPRRIHATLVIDICNQCDLISVEGGSFYSDQQGTSESTETEENTPGAAQASVSVHLHLCRPRPGAPKQNTKARMDDL